MSLINNYLEFFILAQDLLLAAGVFKVSVLSEKIDLALTLVPLFMKEI